MRVRGRPGPGLAPSLECLPPMAVADPTYDLTVLLDVAVDADQRERILADIETLISNEGTLVSAHDWGRRKMAYEIKHKAEAEYHLLQFKGPKALLERLDRTLRITDSVVRYRIIKLAPGTPDPPDLRASAVSDGSEAAPESAA
jgi:small subunit ribosomal protein S6